MVMKTVLVKSRRKVMACSKDLKALKLGGGWTGVDIVADLSVWASKLEAPLVQMNGGDGCMWRRLEACIKMKQKS